MKNVIEKEQCCGCSACYNICPKNAIKMEKDEKGFLFPTIDEEKCIKCGLCQKVCPILTKKEKCENEGQRAYIAKNTTEVRKMSSSGGIFSFLASRIIKKSGVVYGAKFENVLSITHSKASTLQEVKEFFGSKYAQSTLNNIYKQVAEDLTCGKEVLFTGCPCQVAGLYSFLKLKNCDTEKLYTQDFICHGVASPRFYRDYIQFYEKKYRSNAVYVNFRGKPKPGKFQNMIICFDNKRKYTAISSNQDIFYYHFQKNLVLRPACFQCAFASVNRVADITLGDCFANKEELKEMNDQRGLSFVLVNTEKGKNLFRNTEKELQVLNVDVKDYMQINMQRPTTKPQIYERFWTEYDENGFISAIKKYGNYNLKNKIKKAMIYIVNILGMDEWIKRKVKK